VFRIFDQHLNLNICHNGDIKIFKTSNKITNPFLLIRFVVVDTPDVDSISRIHTPVVLLVAISITIAINIIVCIFRQAGPCHISLLSGRIADGAVLVVDDHSTQALQHAHQLMQRAQLTTVLSQIQRSLVVAFVCVTKIIEYEMI
jgi:hypothetical protein